MSRTVTSIRVGSYNGYHSYLLSAVVLNECDARSSLTVAFDTLVSLFSQLFSSSSPTASSSSHRRPHRRCRPSIPPLVRSLRERLVRPAQVSS